MPLHRLLHTAPGLLICYARQVLPLVRQELSRWEALASTIDNAELRKQALASLRAKRFHCEGGAIYAAAAETASARSQLVRLIVALQTISDYLDNLCDRSQGSEGRDFARLHRALRDALDPTSAASPLSYYHDHPNVEDVYLTTLVRTCQKSLGALPGYPVVQPFADRLVRLYNALQVLKHVAPERREALLTAWFAHQARRDPACQALRWWEFGAATGSTLGIFALILLALEPGVTEKDARAVVRAYFPSLAALHILLDYFIDQTEDRVGGDLNFATYYGSPAEAVRRIAYFQRQALSAVQRLPGRAVHRLVVQGLPGLYLSDRKATEPELRLAAKRALAGGGPPTLALYGLCRLMRRARMVTP